MSLVDTLFIGRLGASALAASGLAGIMAFTIASFGMAVISAARVQVGELHGREDFSLVPSQLGAFLRLALVLGPLSIVAGWLLSASLPAIFPGSQVGLLAERYLRARSCGFAFILGSAAISQWLQAQGDTRSGMRAALVANIANIPLNLLFIFGLGWGIAGAGLATAISRAVEFIWLLHQQTQRATALSHGRFAEKGLHWAQSSWSDALAALIRGLPTGGERVLDMIAFTAVPLLLAFVGDTHVAAHEIVLQACLFSFLPLMALSEAAAVLIAQAQGARSHRLVKTVLKNGLALALAHALVCAALFLGLASWIPRAFTSDPEVVGIASRSLLFAALLQFINAGYVYYKGVLHGMSAFHFVAWVTVGCAWAITPPLTYFFGVHLGYGTPGAWIALSVEVTLGYLLLLWRVHLEPQLSSSSGR